MKDSDDVINFKIDKKALIDLVHLHGDEILLDIAHVWKDELRVQLSILRETGAFDKRVEEFRAELEAKKNQ